VKLGVPPLVVFQEPSLDMALKYPISQAELINIHVGEGKAKNMVLNLLP
jgi:ATP-dependent DNA helicase RecQ